MRKKILGLFLCLFMLVPLAFISSACGEKTVSSLELEDIDETYKNTFTLTYDYGEIDGEEIMLRAYTARATYTDGSQERLLREDTQPEDLAGCYIHCYKKNDNTNEYDLVPWFHDTMNAGNYKVEVGYRGATAEMYIFVAQIHETRELTPYITINGRLNQFQYSEPIANADITMNLSDNGNLVNEAIEDVYFITKDQYDYLIANTSDTSKLKNYSYVREKLEYLLKLEHLDTAPVGDYYLCCSTKDYGNYLGNGFSSFTPFTINNGYIRIEYTLEINLTFDYNKYMYNFEPVTTLAKNEWGEFYTGLEITLQRESEDTPYYYINSHPIYENNLTDYGYFELANENEVLDYNDHGKSVLLKFVPYDSNYIGDDNEWANVTIIRRTIDAPYLRNAPDYTVCHHDSVENPKDVFTLNIENDYSDILDAGSDSVSQTEAGSYCRTYSRPHPSITCWTYNGQIVDENTVFDVNNVTYDKDKDKIVITWEIKKQNLSEKPFSDHTLYTYFLDSADGYKMYIMFDPNVVGWSFYTPLSIDEVQFTIKKDNVDVTSTVLSNPSLSYEFTSGDEPYTEIGINYYADFTSTGAGEYEITFTISKNNHYLLNTVHTYTFTIPELSN